MRRWTGRSGVAALLALLLIGVAQAQQLGSDPATERRIALVIGNAAYATAPLRNPVNDARAMTAKLEELGFRVTLLEDAKKREMERAIGAFGQELSRGGVGLFYFAGHGIEVNYRNFLIPVDARIDTEASVLVEGLELNTVLEQLAAAGNRMNIVILDACRNNPFERRFRGSSGGLAQVDAPTGTLIAYATAPKMVAADGDGPNGLYTEALLQAMNVPGLSIEDVFKRVRAQVVAATDNRQRPWESSSLIGDFYINPPVAQEAKQSVGPGAPNAGTGGQTGSAALELAFWESIKDSADPAAYRAYLDAFPNGTFAPLARLRAAGLSGQADAQTTSSAAVRQNTGDATAPEPAVAPAEPAPPQTQVAARPSYDGDWVGLVVDPPAKLAITVEDGEITGEFRCTNGLYRVGGKITDGTVKAWANAYNRIIATAEITGQLPDLRVKVTVGRGNHRCGLKEISLTKQ